MRTTLKRIFIITLTVILLCCSAFPCFAAAEKGIISVTLEDKSKNKINDVTVYLCQVAELNNNGYYPTTAFESSGISISGLINSPDESSAKSVTDYIKSNQIEVLSSESKNGKATFSDLALGIWVVFCDEDSKYTFNPYIVFLPYGVNSHRLLVRGTRIENAAPVLHVTSNAYRIDSLVATPVVAAPILLILLIVLMVKYRDKGSKPLISKEEEEWLKEELG